MYLEPCLRLVEDSDGLRLSLRGVQGVAAGVPNRVLVITQEDDAGTGFRLERPQKRLKQREKMLFSMREMFYFHISSLSLGFAALVELTLLTDFNCYYSKEHPYYCIRSFAVKQIFEYSQFQWQSKTLQPKQILDY